MLDAATVFEEYFNLDQEGELTMAEKLDPQQVVTFEELLRAMMIEQDATRRVLVRKGLLTNEEVLEEIKMVRREMEGKRGR